MQGTIRVGIGGWVYAPWRGTFYPAGMAQRLELAHASRHVTAIEINSTYYRAQAPATYARWAAEVPDGFVFAIKAPMRIVQARDLAATGPQVTRFIDGLAALGDRLGPVVWQFEGNGRRDVGQLDVFAAALPRTLAGRALRHAFEVRDPAAVSPALVAMARARSVALVCADSPEHPAFADVTTDFVYARVMRASGKFRAGYAPRTLDAWATRVRTWASGAQPADLPLLDSANAPPVMPRDVFAFFIGADKVKNPAAAMALLQRLDA